MQLNANSLPAKVKPALPEKVKPALPALFIGKIDGVSVSRFVH